MIRFENVTTDCFTSVSFEIKKGLICRLITTSDYERKILLEALLTFQKPTNGEIFIFDKNIYLISESAIADVYKKIGVVLSYGGLMSNLTVWDNITLPILYHVDILPDDVDQRIFSIFNHLWNDEAYLLEFLKKPSGALSVQQKRLIGLARSMIIDPDLIIYDSLFTGFNKLMVDRLISLTKEFHMRKPGRTSVFISSEEISERDIKADVVLKQDGATFVS